MLANKGILVNEKDHNGNTLLHRATLNRNLKVVKALLSVDRY
ncbi:ankyrin repeat domain-containing protein [Cardinium endosymbiont of Bemisia tabaci]